jgi:3'-5' exonuclease
MKYPNFFIFDIETVGYTLEDFDEVQQEYLVRGAADDEAKAKKVREFSLAPLTAKIVCIGVVVMEWNDGNSGNPEAKLVRQGAFVLDESLEAGKLRRIELADGTRAVASDERTMLHAFWKMLAEHYDDAHLVSFNGIDFDAPFLMMRSAACRVRPTRKIVGTDKPWDGAKKHIDLAKELTFNAFGSANQNGATRKYNFDFYARSFGIPSPKSEGVHGGNVAEYYAEGRTAEIAEYCMRDVRATWELMRYWHEYLYFRE